MRVSVRVRVAASLAIVVPLRLPLSRPASSHVPRVLCLTMCLCTLCASCRVRISVSKVNGLGPRSLKFLIVVTRVAWRRALGFAYVCAVCLGVLPYSSRLEATRSRGYLYWSGSERVWEGDTPLLVLTVYAYPHNVCAHRMSQDEGFVIIGIPNCLFWA